MFIIKPFDFNSLFSIFHLLSSWITVCVYEGTEYTGPNYKGQNPYKVDTFDDCYEDFISTNKKDKTCRFFTFRAFQSGDAGTCQLKLWKGNANPSKDAISGTTKC